MSIQIANEDPGKYSLQSAMRHIQRGTNLYHLGLKYTTAKQPQSKRFRQPALIILQLLFCFLSGFSEWIVLGYAVT
jgi:hypothetical protein